MCADDVVCSGAEPLRVPRLRRRRPARPARRRRARRRRGGGLPRGRLRARRRRDGRAPGPDGAGRVRPRRVLPRDRRARRPARRHGGAGRRRDLRPAVVRPARNGYSLVRSLVAQRDLDSRAPYQEQLRWASATPGRTRLLAREPEHALATLGEVLLAPTRIYARAVLAVRDACSGPPAATCGRSPTSPAAACRATCRARSRPSLGARLDPARWPMPSVDAAARGARRPRGRRAPGDVQRRPRDGASSCPRRSSDAGVALLPRGGRSPARSSVSVVGDRYARRRATRRRPEPGEPVGGSRSAYRGREQPARDRRGRGSRRARRRRRARVRGSRVPRARLGGGAGDRDGTRARVGRRDAVDSALTTPSPRSRRRRRPRRLHADRRPGGARRVRRPDPQRPPVAAAGVPRRSTPCATRSPPASKVTGVHRPPRRRDARRRPDRGAGGRADPRRTTTRPACSSGSTRSSTGCCRAAVALLVAGALAVRRAPAARRSTRPSSMRRHPCRAGRCCRSPTRRAWPSSAAGSSRRGFELVRTGGTARALRDAGLPGDRRRRRDGLPRDARRPGEDAPSGDPRRAARGPPPRRPPRGARAAGDRAVRARGGQPVPVRRAAARAARASRSTSSSRRSTSAGPSMVRAAAKNHASRGDRDVARPIRRGR